MRAIAILLVIPHNMNLFGTAVPAGWSSHLLGSVLDRGWIGVQLFFVLSGFLITGILIDTRNRADHFENFFTKRALRILPLYLATLIGMFVVLPWIGAWPPALHRNPGSEWSYWLFYSNWYGPFHEGEGSMPHLWSLAVEEQFYLLWPLLLFRRPPREVLRICLCVAALGVASRVVMLIVGAPTEAIYSFLVSRMDALALGGATAAAMRVPEMRAALVSHRKHLGRGAAALLLIGALTTRGFTFSSASTLSWGYLDLAVAFALLIVSAVLTDSAMVDRTVGGLLRARWLQSIGRHSYAMYLLHVPLHVVLGQRLVAHLHLAQPVGALQNLLYVAAGSFASYWVAISAYWMVEWHAERLKFALERRRTAQVLEAVSPSQ